MKVSELSGPKLDYWVGKANGLSPRIRGAWADCRCYLEGLNGRYTAYSPSTDWAHGGPIIERKRINLHATHLEDWRAWTDPNGSKQRGDTALIAAMRAFVASRLGPEVPDGKEQ